MMLRERWAPWGAGMLLLVPCTIALWSIVAPAAGAGVLRGAAAPVRQEAARRGVAVESLAVAARRTAPFRPDGRPTAVAYDPVRSEAPQVYAPARPALALNGILQGSAPLAIIEGVPGREGPVLLGIGDTVAGLRVRRIKDGQVTVAGMDTTWQLRIKEQ